MDETVQLQRDFHMALNTSETFFFFPPVLIATTLCTRAHEYIFIYT